MFPCAEKPDELNPQWNYNIKKNDGSVTETKFQVNMELVAVGASPFASCLDGRNVLMCFIALSFSIEVYEQKTNALEDWR